MVVSAAGKKILKDTGLFRVLGFRVLGFGVKGFGFRVWDFGVWSLEARVKGLGFSRVWGSGAFPGSHVAYIKPEASCSVSFSTLNTQHSWFFSTQNPLT